MPKTLTSTVPRVWIGCLSCYASGHLVGTWSDAINAGQMTIKDLHEAAGEPMRDCEEMWCLDSDGIPLDREMSREEATTWGNAYAELEPHLWPALSAWVRSGVYIAEGTGDVPCVSEFVDHYRGSWESFNEYMTQSAEDTSMMDGWPELAVSYFNWAGWINDQEHYHTVMPDPEGGVFIFRD